VRNNSDTQVSRFPQLRLRCFAFSFGFLVWRGTRSVQRAAYHLMHPADRPYGFSPCSAVGTVRFLIRIARWESDSTLLLGRNGERATHAVCDLTDSRPCTRVGDLLTGKGCEWLAILRPTVELRVDAQPMDPFGSKTHGETERST
jgi:hypothetical protein